ncbi:MalY/PatB family protein [Intestinimonas butyriciproducens]|uniref:MalY/PatB family protein n=1 Tax=Intestinimonas butyriciproducens TaxID=1297617 RepID=UPI00195AFDBE|nr:MalY/PatB family protein [Intestinimonas butyriciproducens]MBM6918107.1 pyridoxal phosphate-dependent aminotransferase [Intestinimonas butyriciproducens]
MEEIKYVDRVGTDCNKWDNMAERFGDNDLMALWVADMDFMVPECVRKAAREYADFGIYGYYKVPDAYYQNFIDWEEKYHHCHIEKQWLRFSPGVVSPINWYVNMKTQPGDGVIVLTPVYYPFLDAIRDNGRQLISCDLVRKDKVYHIDYADFEKKIVDNKVKLFILSSPHNPVGRVWKKEELEQLLAICRKHQVFVVADEIHHDLIMPGYEHTEILNIPGYTDMMVVLTAGSKTFNLAGCKNSFVILPDEKLRQEYDDFLNTLRIRGGNAFGYVAVAAAFGGGRPWLDSVIDIIHKNAQYVEETLAEKLPDAVVSPLEGTYLQWVDLGAYVKPDETQELIQNKCRLAVDYGEWFGGERFGSFIRLNLATSPENIKEAVSRIVNNIG